MEITICVGSACHLKGSREVIEQLQRILAERNMEAKVDLKGSFCMNNCLGGVCVKIGDELFSVRPENTLSFFENEVVKRLME
ncbi:(2Fe-2S) ferredoxin domain-containing protein [Lutispora thermophila]|uniref:Thioredoxin-like [2Fe-2S] ferredoxin n=1 Tax=Lutispora thermophila DSM 19022 TaxID=1122184 RepID=A0A1M6EGT9_9FIRM|nr:NAD(P)H-dependent oxidoreductase subunit E [Lutispora thermophila]SHI84727.1 Thioredoxin-like [2Fe-2S] ferredoxin [Lutispora thermophila DSM 19022]